MRASHPVAGISKADASGKLMQDEYVAPGSPVALGIDSSRKCQRRRLCQRHQGRQGFEAHFRRCARRLLRLHQRGRINSPDQPRRAKSHLSFRSGTAVSRPRRARGELPVDARGSVTVFMKTSATRATEEGQRNLRYRSAGYATISGGGAEGARTVRGSGRRYDAASRSSRRG